MENKKILYIILFVSILVLLAYNIDVIEKLILENTNYIKSYYESNFFSFLLIYFILYIVLTSLSLPIALLMGLLAGFIMDVLVGVIVVSFASSVGATVSMLIVRYFFSDFVSKKYDHQYKIISQELNENGMYYLFALRMSPIFPYFMINFCFGLTKVRAIYFYLISQLGMLPGTILIILIGHELNQLVLLSSPLSLELIIYLTALGVLPLIFKKTIKKT